MSITAINWAKHTRGHRSSSTKLVLLVLADYYNDSNECAWPSQAELSEVCEMPIRTVKWVLNWLENAGFITILQRGNQYQSTRYGLTVTNNRPTDSAGAIARKCRGNILQGKGQPVAPTPEVQGQYPASAGAISVGMNHYRTINTTTKEKEKEKEKEFSTAFDELKTIKGVKFSQKEQSTAIEFFIKHDIEPILVEDTVIGMASKLAWDSKKKNWVYTTESGAKRRYTNLLSVLKTWTRRGIKNGKTTGFRNDSTKYSEEASRLSEGS